MKHNNRGINQFDNSRNNKMMVQRPILTRAQSIKPIIPPVIEHQEEVKETVEPTIEQIIEPIIEIPKIYENNIKQDLIQPLETKDKPTKEKNKQKFKDAVNMIIIKKRTGWE